MENLDNKTDNMEKTTKGISDEQKSAAIMLAVQLESSFKLYSYRIISHEDYYARTLELVEAFTYMTKKS